MRTGMLRAFESSSRAPVVPRPIADSHWTWDPSAHAAYEEACTFFLIRFSSPRIDETVDVLKAALHDSQLTAYSLYLLFGYHDVLIRVWVTPQKRLRLVARLKSRGDVIESLEEFRTDSITYHWAHGTPHEEDIHRFSDEIASVAASIMRADFDPSSAPVKQLVDAHILHRVPEAASTDAVKVYLALSKDRADREWGQNSSLLMQTLERLEATAISLYRGAGFADMLVKAVLPSFSGVLPVIAALQRELPGFRPMTLLIGERSALELDNIDTEWKEFSRPLLRLEDELGPSAAAHIAALDEVERAVVGTFFERHTRLLETRAGQYLRGYLRARLTLSPDELSQQLVFILDLERLLRERLVAEGRLAGGETWFQTVKSLVDKVSPEDGSPSRDRVLPKADRWEYAHIGQVLKVMHQLAWINEDHPALGAALRVHIVQLAELRNLVAHGKLFAPEKAAEHWENDWPATADLVGRALTLYAALADGVDEEDGLNGRWAEATSAT